MPNHVHNEIVFSNVHAVAEEAIRKACAGPEGIIDFSGLLPPPLNSWRGSVGSQHKVFPNNDLYWCTANWSTRWNAYCSPSIEREGNNIVLRFRTAWRAPYGWMLALFNTLKAEFSYTYLSEGESVAKTGSFKMTNGAFSSCEWSETDADDTLHRRMHLALWGVEEFLINE